MSNGISAPAGEYRDPERECGISYGNSGEHERLEQFVFTVLVMFFLFSSQCVKLGLV